MCWRKQNQPSKAFASDIVAAVADLVVAKSLTVTKVEVEVRDVVKVVLDPVIALISVIVREVIIVGAIVIADLTFVVDVSVVSIVTVLMRLMTDMLVEQTAMAVRTVEVRDSCKETML